MGKLIVAATPIGNLGDVTPRLLDAIKSSDLVASEDTRVFRKLCSAHGITSARVVSCHEHNEEGRIEEILGVLDNGGTVLFVSNAGTPLVSDPGYGIVKSAINAGHSVSPLPGPNAAISALCCSGLRVDRFAFLGFPPRKPQKLLNFLSEAKVFDGTLIFYESPHRVAKLSASAFKVFGNVPAVLARELTKYHEEFVRMPLGELCAFLDARTVKGECCLLIENRLD